MQAKAPARLIEGGMVTTALVAHIVVAKFAWHSTLTGKCRSWPAKAFGSIARRWRLGEADGMVAEGAL